MKTTTKVAFSAALILGALTSCDKENGFFGRIGSGTIGISSVKAEAPATKAVTEETSQVTLEDGSVFTIHKTIEPYTTEPQTKAVIKKAEDINSFTLYGYLDAAELAKAEGASQTDKNNPNFIVGAGVKKDGSVWHIDGDNYWRNGITHYFWAQSGLDKMETTANSASFTKAANSNEDILVAYASKKWYEHSGDDHSSDNLDINFKHALSAVKVKRGTINYKQKDASGTITDAQEGRVVLDHINLLRLTEGSCAVDKDANFTWTDLANNSITKIQEETETILSIPQNSAAFEVYYTDTIRTVTRPAIINLNDDWKAGNLYSYTLNGTVTVPKVNDMTPTGLNLQFSKKNHKSELVSNNIDMRYYKKIEISWDGLPTKTGNGTFVMVYISKTEKSIDYISKIDQNTVDKYIADKDIIFIYDAFKGSIMKPTNTTASEGCVCTFEVPNDLDQANIYFAYRGGASNAATEWLVKNLNFKVIEYR